MKTEKLMNEYDKPTAKHFEILMMCWSGWVFDFYDLILFTFLLIPIGKELGLDNISLSYILGASLASTAIGGIVFGWLSDRFGRKKVLQWTILTYSIGTFLCGLANNFNLLLVFRVITGLGVGGEWATGQTYIGETFHKNIRGRYGAFMQTGAPVGIILASLVGGMLVESIGWRMCFFISILPAFLVTFIRKRLPESDVWQYTREFREASAEYKDAVKETAIIKILFSQKYRVLFIKSLTLAIFDMSAYWFTYSWLPGYLHQQRGFTLVKSAEWLLVTQAGGFTGYLTFGYFADKFGRRPAFSVYSVIMAAGLIMITIMWDVIVVHQYLIFLFMFLTGFGTGMFSGYGPLFTELYPTSIRNTAMGTAFNLARGIQFFTPVIIAWIAVTYGLSGGISIAAFFALLTGLWVWLLPETKGSALKE